MRPRRVLTISENRLSMPKKKRPSRVVMISTMIPVVTVSLRVGQATLPVSARTWRRNSPGLTLAMFVFVLLKSAFRAAALDRGAGQPSFADACEVREIASGGRDGKSAAGSPAFVLRSPQCAAI